MAPRSTLRRLAPILILVLALISSLAPGGPAQAQGESNLRLLKNINLQGAGSFDPNQEFSELDPTMLALGTDVIFVADDHQRGYELWKTDGTAAGTMLIKDLRPGPLSSFPKHFVALGKTSFFVADDGTSGFELWKTDGSPAGTVLVKDINPGAGSSGASALTLVGTTLFFVADDGVHGYELWQSDGTAAGTVLVKDVRPGASDGVAPYNPLQLVALGNKLYFTADDGVHGLELWQSDGTAAGTVLVKDIVSGSNGSSPTTLTPMGGVLYFFARDAVHGFELWRSDGTAAGTSLVKDINPPGTGDLCPYRYCQLNVIGTTLFFFGNDGVHGYELWRSDGTAAGTNLVKDINPGEANAFNLYSDIPTTVLNGSFYFVADDGTHGPELWRSDGTAAGTSLVKAIAPTTATYGHLRSLVTAGGAIYFTANDEVHGPELWRSDGTAAGTSLVKDLRPGALGSITSAQAAQLYPVGNTIFFRANDGTNGLEPWRSDGTAAGTTLIQRIAQADRGSLLSTDRAIWHNDAFYFMAGDGNGVGIWRSNGTTTGTLKVVQLPSDCFADKLTLVGTRFFFSCSRPDRVEVDLWQSDGTTAGTSLVKQFKPLSANWEIFHLTALGDALVFSANDGTNGRELWRSDGTAAGTSMLKDIYPGSYSSGATPPYEITPYSSNPHSFTVMAGTLYFVASSPDGTELWKSDGTPEGTIQVKDINLTEDANGNPNSANPKHLTVMGDRLYFQANDGVHGTELWQSDGTLAGTGMVKDINPGATGSEVIGLAVMDNLLYLRASSNGSNPELWRSDGTESGTIMIKRFSGPVSYPAMRKLVVANGRLFFSLYGSPDGLWQSDGTAEGTSFIKGVISTTELDTSLVGMGDHAYYVTRGALWQSDGTAEGTLKLRDFSRQQDFLSTNNPSPGTLTVTPRGLFFSADDGTTGREPWLLRVGPMLESSNAASGAPGSAFALVASGFAVGSKVALTLTPPPVTGALQPTQAGSPPLGTLTADANGSVSFAVQFGNTAPLGVYTITASSADLQATIELTLSASEPVLEAPDGLPLFDALPTPAADQAVYLPLIRR